MTNQYIYQGPFYRMPHLKVEYIEGTIYRIVEILPTEGADLHPAVEPGDVVDLGVEGVARLVAVV